MRVLFASTAHQGHLRPMLPLARALRDRGHDVAWVSGPEARGSVEGMGLRFFLAGDTTVAYAAALAAQWPERSRLTAQQASETHFGRLFGGIVAPAMQAGMGAAVDQWRPELVVNGAAALAAPLVCRQRGVRHVTHGFGLPLLPARLDQATQRWAPAWDHAGLPLEPDAGLYRHQYIDIGPPAWRAGAALPACPVLALQPVRRQPRGAEGLPDAVRALLDADGAPVVYLSFGTAFNRVPALQAAVHALATCALRLVVSLGPGGDMSLARSLPPHVAAAPWIDQQVLLPWCAAVVSHGGAGTVLAALAHGLPQLCLPQGADQFRNGLAVARVEAGLMLQPDEGTDAALCQAVVRLLTDPLLAWGAGQMAQQIAAMPMAEDVAESVTHW